MEMNPSRSVLSILVALCLGLAAPLPPALANGELTVLAMLRPAPPERTQAPPTSPASPASPSPAATPGPVTAAPPAPPTLSPEALARIQAQIGTPVRPPACLDIHYQRVQVEIADHAAVTRVRQQYRNRLDAVLEGEYRFRLAPEASVSDFAIWDGDTRVAGMIRRKEEARAIYDTIVSQRRDPGQLEQIGENLFSAKVFPILPLSDKKIEIEYRESLRVEDGIACYRYPLTTTQGNPTQVEELAISLDIRDGAEITGAWSPTPGVAVHHHDRNRVSVSYEARNAVPASDLLVYYSVRSPVSGMRVRTHRGDPAAPGYWMLSIAPPDSGLPARAKDVVFVVDTSGSMTGAKIDQARRALKYCLGTLQREDRFAVLRFSSDVEPMSPGLTEAAPKAVADATRWVGRLQPAGGTNIDGALTAALRAFPVERVMRPRYVVFLTDGQPTAGDTDTEVIRKHAREANQVEARVFTFGIDEAARLPLLSGLAQDHRGESISVGAQEDVSTALPLFFGKLTVPLFEECALEFEGVSVSSVHPGKLPHFYLGRQVTVVGRYRTPGAGLVKLTARVDGQPVTYQLPVELPEKATEGAAIPRLWAQQEVDALIAGRVPESLPGELKDEIVRLSMLHDFATPFTSFIAVPDSEKARLPEELRRLLEDKDHLVTRVTPDGQEILEPRSDQPLGRVLDELSRLGGFSVTTDATVPLTALVAVPAAAPEGALRQIAAAQSVIVTSETGPDGRTLFRLSRTPPPAASPQPAEELDLDLSSSTTPAAQNLRLALKADRSGRPDAARKTFEHAKAAIRLNPEYKRILQQRLRNSEVSRQVGSIVSEIVEKSENDELTDAETEKYAAKFQQMLGQKNLTTSDLKDRAKLRELMNADDAKMLLGPTTRGFGSGRASGQIVSRVPTVPPLPNAGGNGLSLDANSGVGSIKPALSMGGGPLQTAEAQNAFAYAPTVTKRPTAARIATAANTATTAMDRKFRELQQQVSALRTRVRMVRGRLGSLKGAAAAGAPAAFIEDVRVEPALVAGGERARIALVVRAAKGAKPVVSWHARGGYLTDASEAGATWEAPAFPGVHELTVELVMATGERVSTLIELVVFEPGQITYAPQYLDARIAELEQALAALRLEHAALVKELDELLVKLTPEAAKAIEAMPVLTGRGR